MTEIIKFSVDDVRFPTSKDLTGSDAVHTDPDYSATYVTEFTSDENLKGNGKPSFLKINVLYFSKLP